MITSDLIAEVVKLMACGKSMVQVAAALRMSKAKFNRLLTSNQEDAEMQASLKDAIEFGHTLYESHFEAFYVDAMGGKIDGCKEGLIKSYMQNKFKWADKTENKETKDSISELTDDELNARISASK